ncbi:ABC transporter substrate-binding protein [Pseudoalteromonas sp. J010]|uniref:ABC transporter substrate-binding protein n=1 Tax=Pseudoalteromonas sp. J010 TaxID=998465 RepID=UPI000F64F9E4|nr:ABC transporter substrate-binding protein [Pseudoalteromonas sp. J010]RRS06805.1 ABC transporter substrate-binding protein [Pseudoalteromonas sp. J010]
MRYLVALFAAIFSIFVYSADLKIEVVSDYDPDRQTAPNDLATQLLIKLERSLGNAMTMSFIAASRAREWRELSQNPNACLYNKVKTAEREQVAVFTDLPLMSFPANRLILRNQKEIPDIVSLATVIDRGLRIGVSDGRSYGNKIDNLISQHKDTFWFAEGNQSAYRLRAMLSQGKLDGIIEYSSVFIAEHPSAHSLNQYSFHAITEADFTIFGYIACARSEEGKAAIRLFQQALSEPRMQAKIIDAHKGLFFELEEPYIIQSLENAFSVQQ